MNHRLLASPLVMLLAVAAPGVAEDRATSTAAATLTLEQIMADPDWLGNPPERPYWSDDGSTVYFSRKRDGAPLTDLWRVPRDGGTAERVADEELGAVDAAGGTYAPDREQRVWSEHGDLFVKDLASGVRRQLTRSAARESRPFFLADGRRVGFERDGRILIRDLDSGLEADAVELLTEDDPDDEEPDDTFLAAQQRRLFDVVRQELADEALQRDRERALRAADPTRLAPTVYLGEDVDVVSSHLSPTGSWMLLVTAKAERDRGRRDQMPDYVSADGYVEVHELRPKVGAGEPIDHRLLRLDLATGSVETLDLAGLPGIADDPLAELREAAEARKEAQASEGESDEPEAEAEGDEESGDDPSGAEDEPAAPRPVTIEEVAFTVDGERAAVQFHSYDNKDRWIALIGEKDEIEPIHRLSDPEGWINWSFNELGWLRDGRLWYLSEESGWSQLFVYDPDAGASERVTDGDYLVQDVELDRDQRYFYFTANAEHPGTYDTYRAPTAGGAVERVTNLGGLTASTLSPDGAFLLIRHSSSTEPPELFVQESRPGAAARRLTHTVSDAFAAVDWQAPEIVPVPSSHIERPIWSRLYRPAADAQGRGADGRRPAVVFIHGAGYLQNAHSGWSGYFREYMFHNLLVRRGYVVLDMDYRASRGYGRDWRTAIYRQMGHPEVEDLADGVGYLVAEHGVDAGRVGVYGGSYGGFLTFMAMFRQPELFAAGAALRPVTDWAHYNHPYTSNILNTPEIDPEAYERSSPIEFADGLARPLLICAGMQDDNVFFQDTVRLVQRLIELGKTGFETAFYPVEPHGFRRPDSWLDEYRRIFALFERHLAP